MVGAPPLQGAAWSVVLLQILDIGHKFLRDPPPKGQCQVEISHPPAAPIPPPVEPCVCEGLTPQEVKLLAALGLSSATVPGWVWSVLRVVDWVRRGRSRGPGPRPVLPPPQSLGLSCQSERAEVAYTPIISTHRAVRDEQLQGARARARALQG